MLFCFQPLNSCPTSTWTQYFQDNEVVAQINRDVRRLCPEISFFQMATDYPCKLLQEHNVEPLSRRVNNVLLESEVLVKNRSGTTNLVNSRKLAVEEYACLSNGQEAHWQVVERILFVYAKLNPGVKYVQGMNEILGPIYYVFASDADNEWRKFAEADTFFCFQNLMSEIRDNFIRTMDDSSLGIEFRMKTLFEKLRLKDEKVYNHLTISQQLLPQYFAFRWISLMLSQEFLLPDVIRIWDSIFCSDRKLDFLIDVCLQMILNIRDKLLLNDFSGNMRLLQVI
uniref:Rab-GAP TBC domain-containing protein n=1 Tax=Romanomermis culicivorax TaxID=13658 RepID=A0A915J1P4_ROMCU